MRIAKIIENENLESPEEIELLKMEIHQYLQTNMANRSNLIQNHADGQLSPDRLDTFFRNQERQENVKRLLQYMLSFMVDIPAAKTIGREPVNPVLQFKEFVQYQVGLLGEKDVINAISRELKQQRLHEQGNDWYYEARVMDQRLELEHLLTGVSGDHDITHLLLFQVLENLCLFWFEIGSEDVRQARRSDLYIYKLARLLQHQLKKSASQITAQANDTESE